MAIWPWAGAIAGGVAVGVWVQLQQPDERCQVFLPSRPGLLAARPDWLPSEFSRTPPLPTAYGCGNQQDDNHKDIG